MKDKDKIIKQIKKINGTMAQEDMPLNKDIIFKIYKCKKGTGRNKNYL